jgi:hypothetical protein
MVPIEITRPTPEQQGAKPHARARRSNALAPISRAIAAHRPPRELDEICDGQDANQPIVRNEREIARRPLDLGRRLRQ